MTAGNEQLKIKKTTKVIVTILFIINCALSITGCYSFTGSSVPPHLKTVAIPLVEDVSGFGEAGIREKFTRKLIDLFVNDNSLQIGERTTSDSIIEGTIVSITDAPFVISGGEVVKTRKVTITVRASFTDMKFRKKVWEKDFSNYGQYDQGQPRTAAVEDAVNKVAEDILLETVSGW
ncbi:MAG: LptE family protein [Bacteroidota bacterium]|nr:LptE family protein [Bacteroidota bacterium]